VRADIFTLCDFAQESGGKLTVVGTFDTIIARSFPCVHPLFSVAVRIRFDLWEFTRHHFRIEIRDLKGNLAIEPISGSLEIRGSENTTALSHLIYSIANFQCTAPGVLNFVLSIDDKEIASIPLHIRKG